MCRVRGWNKHLPGRILGALPKRKWVKRLQRPGRELLVRLWRHVDEKSPATRSRWQWTWLGDDSLFQKYGQHLGLVGIGWSGQEHRVRCGIDGLLLVVVIGEGKLVVPVDFVVRRPDPQGPGRPCRDKLTWLQVMLDRTWAALQRRCRRLPPPLVVADGWCGDTALMTPVETQHHGTLLVEVKTTYMFHLPDGRRVKGRDFRTRADWPWHDSAQVPGVRDARLTAISPSDGRVTVVIVEAPGRERSYLLCRATPVAAPRLIRAWKRRSWIEHPFRTLKHLLAAEEFLRRFLLHVLPARFMRVRHYGLLANASRKESLATCRALLGAEPPPAAPSSPETWQELFERVTGRDPLRCPKCGRRQLIMCETLAPQNSRGRAPPGKRPDD